MLSPKSAAQDAHLRVSHRKVESLICRLTKAESEHPRLYEQSMCSIVRRADAAVAIHLNSTYDLGLNEPSTM